MNITTLVVLGAHIGLLTACWGATNTYPEKVYKVPAGGYPVSVEASGSPKVDALVCNLVSRRAAPYRSAADPPMSAIFADRYSTPEVESALRSLKEMGPAAFPALIKHLGDDRYSFSRVEQGWLNFSVGDAVMEILDDGHYQHGGYLTREVSAKSGGGYLSFTDYLRERGAERWAEWAKAKSRLAIQMDFIDWCINKEQERGFVDEAQKKLILGNYEAARQRMVKEYSKPGGKGTRSQQVPH